MFHLAYKIDGFEGCVKDIARRFFVKKLNFAASDRVSGVGGVKSGFGNHSRLSFKNHFA